MTRSPDVGHGAGLPQDPLAGTGGGRFGRMFAAGSDPGIDEIGEVVRRMRVLSELSHSENDEIPAGFTYLGQFIDHDLTFDALSKADEFNELQELVNFRTPRLDLDSVYGAGPQDQPFLYEWADRNNRGVKLLVGRLPAGNDRAEEDLPRNEEGLALIGDARNDENLIVSQLHLLFIRFHNNVVEQVRKDEPALAGQELFERARTHVRRHYQWIVVDDFLRRVVGQDLVDEVLRPAATPDDTPTVRRLFFEWEDELFIPVEFSGAAYRFGHAMVRPSYLMRPDKVADIFPPDGVTPGNFDLSGFRPLPHDLRIDWDLFFFDPPHPPAGTSKRNHSLLINNRLTPQLFALPDQRVLPLLNMKRGRALQMPSGQEVAAEMQRKLGAAIKPLDAFELQLDPDGPACLNDNLLKRMPLWYYLLCDANFHGAGGHHLGPIGGRIVAEVLLGLLEADSESFLKQPGWRPTLRARERGEFKMVDLVSFALGRTP
ncbi:heme peroxidase family protein [soil metagenome]